MTWLDDFVEYAQSNVDDRVREAYWSRGADDGQIQLYRLGYIDGALPDVGLPEDFVRWSFNGEKLVDSYVLPLTNALNEVRGVQFRSVERSKSGYTDYFLDETEPTLFGLGPAVQAMWKSEQAVLVEGGFDVFPVQRVFLPETVATLTAKVNAPFVRLLRRLVKRVYVSYDRDNTGRRGTSSFIRWYGKEFDVIDVEYPEIKTVEGKVAKDPSEIWEAWGDEQLGEHLRCIAEGTRTEKSNAPDLY